MALKVLVVDDSRDSADLLHLLLARWGHSAKVAYDGDTAVSVAQSYQPNVAIVDLSMAGMDGYETAHKLRIAVDGIRLIAFSGHPDLVGASLPGIFDFHLLKGNSSEEIERLLSGLCFSSPQDKNKKNAGPHE